MKRAIQLFVIFQFYFFFANAQELTRYICNVERIITTEFINSRTFDSEGIIKSKGRYHPLSIAQFGISTYYNFLDTGDSTYYHHCMNQIKYFKDESKLVSLFDGEGIGLPYNYNYRELKAPWYSGMTQGYAISFLLRYYELSKDESILPIIEKIAYVLMMPQELGGTISISKEGCTWIEEYPNRKSSPQVLNGFINGMIGLYEYTLFFPNDQKALRIFNESYECLKISLEHYDTPTWSTYNRAGQSIRNTYLRYQIYEMEQLYEIFEDPIFDAQRRIWSVFASLKFLPANDKLRKYKNHITSSIVQKKDSLFFSKPIAPLYSCSNENIEIQTFYSLKNLNKYLVKRKIKKPKATTKENYYLLTNTGTDTIDFINLNLSASIDEKFIISFYNVENSKLIEANPKYYINDNNLEIYNGQTSINQIVIKVSLKKKIKPIKLDTLLTYNTQIDKPPFFIYQISKKYKLSANETQKVILPALNTNNVMIFYKSADTEPKLKTKKWKAVNRLMPDQTLTPSKTEVYEFLIVANWDSPLSMIGQFQLELMEN